MIVFVIVIFFGADPVGVLLPQEFSTREECLEVASPITAIAPPDHPARGYCVMKKIKEHA